MCADAGGDWNLLLVEEVKEVTLCYTMTKIAHFMDYGPIVNGPSLPVL